jgi:phage protein D
MPDSTVAERLVLRQRPTLRFDGQPDERAAELLLALSVSEQDGGFSAAELRFGNWASDPQGGGALAFDGQSVLKLGAALKIYAGDEQRPREIFDGRITALEGEWSGAAPPELTVLAEDSLQAARMARHSRVWRNQSLKAVVDTVAQDLGLTAAAHSDLQAIRGDFAQLGESDLAFLRRLLDRHDADLQVVGRELQAALRGNVRRGEVSLQLHAELLQVRARADLADQVTEVRVQGWDAAQGQAASAQVSGPAHAGPGQGTHGAALLQRTLGARSHLLSQVQVRDAGEASAVAQAAFDQRLRRFVAIDAVAIGNPEIRVGTHVAVGGLDARWNNTYCVTRACHRFDTRRGYLTEFSASCAYLNS